MTNASTNSGADLTPILPPDPLDIRLSLTALIHWADSRDVRRGAMSAVEFPTDDIPMFLVVNQLAYRGALRPTDLASVLGTTKANMSKIIRKLEEQGLVVRISSPHDDRSVLVALTAEGRAIGARIIDQTTKKLHETLVTWSDDDVQSLRRVLAKFAREAVLQLAMRAPTGVTQPPAAHVAEADDLAVSDGTTGK